VWLFANDRKDVLFAMRKYGNEKERIGFRVAPGKKAKIKQEAAAMGLSGEAFIERAVDLYMSDSRMKMLRHKDAPATVAEWRWTHWWMRLLRHPQMKAGLEECCRQILHHE
jgi:hypothetical protein